MVKQHRLEGDGLGLIYNLRNSVGEEGEVITVYVGSEAEKEINSVYSIANKHIVLDCKSFRDGDTLIGGHLANNYN